MKTTTISTDLATDFRILCGISIIRTAIKPGLSVTRPFPFMPLSELLHEETKRFLIPSPAFACDEDEDDALQYTYLLWDIRNRRFILTRLQNQPHFATIRNLNHYFWPDCFPFSSTPIDPSTYSTDPLAVFPIDVDRNFKMPGGKKEFYEISRLLDLFILAQLVPEAERQTRTIVSPMSSAANNRDWIGMTTYINYLEPGVGGGWSSIHARLILALEVPNLDCKTRPFRKELFRPKFMSEVLPEFAERCLADPESLIYTMTAMIKKHRIEKQAVARTRARIMEISPMPIKMHDEREIE